MQIEKYIFCTNVCGSICREATLVNLSHSSICNLIVCVHSPQRYCCFFLYRHTHRQACTHIHRHRYRHRQTQTHTQIHSSIFNLIVWVHSPQRYCCYFLYRHRHTHRKLIHRRTQRQTHRHTQRHTHRHADTLKYTNINTQNTRSKARSIDFNENYAISSSIICCQVTKGLMHNKLINSVDDAAIAKRYQDCMQVLYIYRIQGVYQSIQI